MYVRTRGRRVEKVPKELEGDDGEVVIEHQVFHRGEDVGIF